jgi:hypothetical protein
VRGKRQKVTFFFFCGKEAKIFSQGWKNGQNESVFRSSKIKPVFVVIGPIQAQQIRATIEACVFFRWVKGYSKVHKVDILMVIQRYNWLKCMDYQGRDFGSDSNVPWCRIRHESPFGTILLNLCLVLFFFCRGENPQKFGNLKLDDDANIDKYTV